VLQEAFNTIPLLGQNWTKFALVVDEDDLCSLKIDNHIGLLVAVDIDEAESHRDQVDARAVELGANIDTSMTYVTARQFDNFNAPMQVDETIPMRVLTTQSSPAHAGTLFLPMRISIFVELIVQKLIIQGKKTNKRRELHLGRNAYFSVCHNIRSIGPSWDFDFMYS